MSGDAQRELTVEEYLAFERASAEKHEFVDGPLYLMAGARQRHVRLQGNLFGTLFQLLGQKADRNCGGILTPTRWRVGADRVRPGAVQLPSLHVGLSVDAIDPGVL